MQLIKTRLDSAHVRIELIAGPCHEFRFSVIESSRWINKRQPATREHRDSLARVLMTARADLRLRAATVEVANV